MLNHARAFVTNLDSRGKFTVNWAPKTDNVDVDMDLVEGRLRCRKGKKWKTRWAVLRRVNPATDVLNLVLYPKDSTAAVRQKEKGRLSFKGFSGLQVLNKMDKHFNVIVIITTDDVIPLSFETIDQRAHWLANLQGYYGKEKSFEGIVPHKQKIKAGEAVLRFYSTFFSLTKKDSHRLIGHWNFTSLPKYGAVDGGFAFQAIPESPTGDKPAIFFFATRSGKEIHALFDSVCRPGEVGKRQDSHSVESGQSEPIATETQAQPGFLKRAWLRMSKKHTKGKAHRIRSQSLPSTTRGQKKSEQTSPQSPQDVLSFRRNESMPNFLGRTSNTDDVFEPAKSPPPGYENVVGVTPEGYEVMIPETTETRRGTCGSGAFSPTRNGSEGRGIGNTVVDGKDSGDTEGYVVLEGRDEELLEKLRKDSCAKGTGKKEDSPESRNDKIVSSSPTTEMTERRDEGNDIPEDSDCEKQEGKLPETEKPGLTNVDVHCEIVVTPSDANGEQISKGEGTIMNGHRDITENITESNSETKSNRRNTNERVTTINADYVNGDITQKNRNGKDMKSPMSSVSTRRGLKTPPMLNLTPASTVGSAEHLYVNSPKIVEYVNVQGARPSRPRNKSSSSKLNPYAMYDGNDDSIYHSVESLMPSHPGYQNVLGDDPSRSHSFENIVGHSYANVSGRQPSYQNIGQVDRSYVNMMSMPYQGNLNYVKIAGVDSPQASSPLPTSTSPKSSDYTWIDERKTKLLQDTAKLHSERRQENLPRVMKK